MESRLIQLENEFDCVACSCFSLELGLLAFRLQG